ncbi:hypothetical protein BDV28DRAFT_157466 [Aspergillus coremiiformis]|uniref:Uncharacterized protein n=1 Tax=Aspergillus coremiiformis TaxID=138285 RepID=A0A5N6Z7R2_9EURO|nr:hypothetical protein BDV28DRAFT_157466 [Aspergillus coremiiformis]
MEYTKEDILKERGLGEKAARKKSRKSLTIPAAALERRDFKWPRFWSLYYRTILDDPASNRLCITGIGPATRTNGRFDAVPIDPRIARVCGVAKGRRNAVFRMAVMLGHDRNRMEGKRIGYPMHLHCWLLLDRVVGHDLVRQHLREFVQAAEAFWKANTKEWLTELSHHKYGKPFCHEKRLHWLKRQSDVDTTQNDEAGKGEIDVYHISGSPLRIPGIKELTAQVTRERNDGVSLRGSPTILNLPLDIAVIIVDVIYKSRPHCRERIDDTRNVLEAFQWKLPGAYWRARCNPRLIFEVDDLVRTQRAVDWASFCLGLEELLLDDDWYCNSGLNNRCRTLRFLEGIKGRFLGMIETDS